MGKRSRKRSSGTAPRPSGGSAPGGAAARRSASAPAATPSAHAKVVSRKARRDEAPPAPWDPFPLVELSILVGIILIVLAFVLGGDLLLPLLGLGFALVAVSAIELAVREHFAGFRSHTTLLAGSSTFVTVVPTYLIAGPEQQQVILAVGGLTFALAFWQLRGLFARRAGGLSFRA